MLTSHSEIRQIILDNWEEINDSPDPKGILDEYAESDLPIYNNDIIKEWTEMPSDYDNRWQEVLDGEIEEHTITSLMLVDLYQYYTDTYYEIWEDIKSEREDNA